MNPGFLIYFLLMGTLNAEGELANLSQTVNIEIVGQEEVQEIECSVRSPEDRINSSKQRSRINFDFVEKTLKNIEAEVKSVRDSMADLRRSAQQVEHELEKAKKR